MKTVPLSKGKTAIVSDKDFTRASRLKWYYHPNGQTAYAHAHYRDSDGKRRMIKLHRFLLNLADHQEVDHKDGNGLNNQRSNLRISTHQQNACNHRIPRHNKSGFKGVSWHKKARSWTAQITVNRSVINLGFFATKKEAAHTYDKAAKMAFGRFALTNKQLGIL